MTHTELCPACNACFHVENCKWTDVKCFVCLIGSADKCVWCADGVHPVSLAVGNLHQAEVAAKHERDQLHQ